MTSKPDGQDGDPGPIGQDAYPGLIEEGRRRLGPPPTAEQVEALLAGELPEAEAERIRELLAHYPDLARVMLEPLPADANDVLTEEQLAEDRRRLHARVHGDSAPPVPFPERRITPRFLASAAALVIVLGAGGIYLKSRSQPHGEPKILHADGQRSGSTGGEPAQTPIQLIHGIDYLLQPLYRPSRVYREYRLELLDLESSPPRSVWTRDDVRRDPSGAYPVELATGTLEPGRYQLVLYGVDGEEAARLATYTLRLTVP